MLTRDRRLRVLLSLLPSATQALEAVKNTQGLEAVKNKVKEMEDKAEKLRQAEEALEEAPEDKAEEADPPPPPLPPPPPESIADSSAKSPSCVRIVREMDTRTERAPLEPLLESVCPNEHWGKQWAKLMDDECWVSNVGQLASLLELHWKGERISEQNSKTAWEHCIIGLLSRLDPAVPDEAAQTIAAKLMAKMETIMSGQRPRVLSGDPHRCAASLETNMRGCVDASGIGMQLVRHPDLNVARYAVEQLLLPDLEGEMLEDSSRFEDHFRGGMFNDLAMCLRRAMAARGQTRIQVDGGKTQLGTAEMPRIIGPLVRAMGMCSAASDHFIEPVVFCPLECDEDDEFLRRRAKRETAVREREARIERLESGLPAGSLKLIRRYQKKVELRNDCGRALDQFLRANEPSLPFEVANEVAKLLTDNQSLWDRSNELTQEQDKNEFYVQINRNYEAMDQLRRKHAPPEELKAREEQLAIVDKAKHDLARTSAVQMWLEPRDEQSRVFCGQG